MGHADISTTMIYVHHVPQPDAADKLSRLVAAAESVPQSAASFGTRWGHDRGFRGECARGRKWLGCCGFFFFEWARLDSNQGPTDYESAALTS